MGDGTKDNPFTRADVEAKMKEHGSPEEVYPAGKYFQAKIDLSGLCLSCKSKPLE
jgi:hypothetical protein